MAYSTVFSPDRYIRSKQYKADCMIELIFATSNQHKLEEAQAIVGDSIQLISLTEEELEDELPEEHDTLQENAIQKAKYIYNIRFKNCFAEDTGLEVQALNGAPGVHSARYAGEEKDPTANLNKLLHDLRDESNRKARFHTVIALIWEGETHLFEGAVQGRIIENPRGEDGFGYDPVFVPDGYVKTFAELDSKIKNELSHRNIALNKMQNFLLEHHQK